MARLPAPGGLDVSRWPMIFGAGESWYAKPDAGALIVSPAEEVNPRANSQCFGGLRQQFALLAVLAH